MFGLCLLQYAVSKCGNFQVFVSTVYFVSCLLKDLAKFPEFTGKITITKISMMNRER